MSAEHGHGHGSDEYRVVASMREQFGTMAGVVKESLKALPSVLLFVLSLGMIQGFEDSDGHHGGGHH